MLDEVKHRYTYTLHPRDKADIYALIEIIQKQDAVIESLRKKPKAYDGALLLASNRMKCHETQSEVAAMLAKIVGE